MNTSPNIYDASKPYLLEYPGLAEAVAACVPGPKHQSLLKRLRSFDSLDGIQLATTRGDRWKAQRKVFTADGALVADNHHDWLTEQLQADAGKAQRTYDRLKNAGYVLSQCELTMLYFVLDSGSGNPAEFLQFEIDVEDEFLHCNLFSKWPYSTLRNLCDLENAEGYGLPADARMRVRPSTYRLRRVIDVSAFVDLSDQLELARRAQFRQRHYRVTEKTGAVETISIKTPDELFPGWDRFNHKHRRIFEDWRYSSAGRGGARFCEHWALNLSDHTDAKGERTLSLIPMWTFRQKLAEIDASKGNSFEFYGKLQKPDARVGVPFGWYFFMLHGNRVHADAGERLIEFAEAGGMFLAEHDYRILKDWQAQPYSF